jgi:hypothetical protein
MVERERGGFLLYIQCVQLLSILDGVGVVAAGILRQAPEGTGMQLFSSPSSDSNA